MQGDHDLIRAFLVERGEVFAIHAELRNPWQVEDDARVQAVADQIDIDAQNTDLLDDMLMTGRGPRDPRNGFTDLTTELVSPLTGAAGLTWGGQYNTGKDLMHFDWRRGTIRNHHRE